MFAHLRFRQLEMICLLAETGSVRATSRQMHLSAPALSKSLREIEHVVGMPLFDRTTHGLTPTAGGKEFARGARVVLRHLDSLRQSKAFAAGQPRSRTLRVGTAPFVAWCIVPEILRRLAAAGEPPRIHLIEARIIALADQLANGELDAILTLMTPEALEVLDTGALAVDQIYAERMRIVAAPAKRHKAGKRSWKSLEGENWILPPPTYTQRLLVQRTFLAAGRLPPEPVIESTNIPAMLNLVKAGLGITAAFDCTVRDDIANGRLQVVRTETDLPSVPIGLAYRKATADIASLHAIRDALYAHVDASGAAKSVRTRRGGGPVRRQRR
jgi:DNA-binding transcriptional LysR family regulator